MIWPLHHRLDVDALDPRAKVIVHLVDGGRDVADRLAVLLERQDPWFVIGARAWVLAVYEVDVRGSSDQEVLDLIPRHMKEP